MKCPVCNGTGKVTPKVNVTQDGKPVQVNCRNCMGTGKLNKFLAANALLEQPFVRDDKKKVKDILGGATVTTFARFAVGG